VGYSDFLLGYPSTTQQPLPNTFTNRNLSHQYGLYFQATWKATRRLTINAGIRYDLQMFEPNIYGNNALFVPRLPSGTVLNKVVFFGASFPPSTAKNPVIPGFLGLPIVFASQVGLSNNVWDYLTQDTNHVAPRVGFVYQVMPRTVVRGAFGVFYNLLPASNFDSSFATNIPFLGSETYTNGAPVLTFTMSAFFGDRKIRRQPHRNRAASHRHPLHRGIQSGCRAGHGQRVVDARRARRTTQLQAK